MERQLFAMTLESTGGNRARAAELLGVSLRTVRNKVREFGLPPRGNYRHAAGDLQTSKEQLCP
jgi:DNA-binding NtrC family response regulator